MKKKFIILLLGLALVIAPFIMRAQEATCDPYNPNTWQPGMEGCLDTDNPNAVPINQGAAPKDNNASPSKAGMGATSTNAQNAKSENVKPDDLVQCGRGDSAPCDFNDLMSLINRVIQFLLFKMALPIAAIMFAYAGFLLVTSGGSTESRSKAKKIFTNVAIGFILAVAAWLIIRTILSIVGFDGSWIGF